MCDILSVYTPMKANLKGKQVRIYVDDESEAILAKISELTGATDTFLTSQILRAGLRSCRDAGNRLPLPLRFEIVEAAEPPTTKPRR